MRKYFLQFLICKKLKKTNTYPIEGFLRKNCKPPNGYKSRWGVGEGFLQNFFGGFGPAWPAKPNGFKSCWGIPGLARPTGPWAANRWTHGRLAGNSDPGP